MISVDEFRAIFSEFADNVKYPDALITYQIDKAECYLGDVNLKDCRSHEVMLFIAHLLSIHDSVRAGNVTAIVTSSSRSDVSVSIAKPPSSTTFLHWLSTTSYGLEFLSLIKIRSAGGLYVGGSPEIIAFKPLNGGW